MYVTAGVHYGTACSLERQKRESTRCSRPLGLQFASPPTKGEKTINLVVCDGWRGLLEVPVPSWEQAELGTHPTPPSATRELLKGRGSAQLHIANAITEKVDGKFFVTDSSARSDAGRVSQLTLCIHTDMQFFGTLSCYLSKGEENGVPCTTCRH